MKHYALTPQGLTVSDEGYQLEPIQLTEEQAANPGLIPTTVIWQEKTE